MFDCVFTGLGVSSTDITAEVEKVHLLSAHICFKKSSKVVTWCFCSSIMLFSPAETISPWKTCLCRNSEQCNWLGSGVASSSVQMCKTMWWPAGSGPRWKETTLTETASPVGCRRRGNNLEYPGGLWQWINDSQFICLSASVTRTAVASPPSLA